MQWKGIQKREAGKFITRYNVTYETKDHREKVYEMISRKKEISTQEELRGTEPDAVVMIIMDGEGERLLLNREFRLAAGSFVYNFPAGLIEPGESPEESAKRELREETGLELYQIEDQMGLSYSAVGFSNELNVCIVGKARGEFRESTSTAEEIEAGWYTRAEVRRLLETERFAGRTQAFCYLWSRT